MRTAVTTLSGVGDDPLLQRVGERQRDALPRDPPHRCVARSEPLVSDDGRECRAPSALVRVLLHDDKSRGSAQRGENGADVQRYQAPQVDELHFDDLPGRPCGGGEPTGTIEARPASVRAPVPP